MSRFSQLDLENAKGPKAVTKTNRGGIAVQSFPEQASKTAKDLAELAEKGYYDGVIFCRVIPDFMIQGGDLTGTGMGGESAYGEAFEDELSRDVFNLRGALSMVDAGPNTDGSQFFAITNQNVPAQMMSQLEDAGFPKEVIEVYKQGGTPWLDFRHTVFGHVVDGMDVVDKIDGVQWDAQDRPAFDAVMDTVEIIGEQV